MVFPWFSYGISHKHVTFRRSGLAVWSLRISWGHLLGFAKGAPGRADWLLGGGFWRWGRWGICIYIYNYLFIYIYISIYVYISGWWWLEHVDYFSIGNVIIPTDFHIFQRGSNDQPGIIWANQNDLTTTSLESLVNKGNHPQMAALIKASELFQFTQI